MSARVDRALTDLTQEKYVSLLINVDAEGTAKADPSVWKHPCPPKEAHQMIRRSDRCGCCNNERSGAFVKARLFLAMMQGTWAVTQVWELLAR